MLAWTKVGITFVTGHWDAVGVQAGKALLRNNGGSVARMTRCFADGVVVYLMPTAVIGHAVTMLSDAVRNMNQKSEEVTEKERRDFLTTQVVGAFLRSSGG